MGRIMYHCRYCKEEIKTMFVDLGLAPLSNDYIQKESVGKGQYHLPLQAAVCDKCRLVQVLDFEMPEGIFNSEYKYFSSYSSSWLQHCKSYVDMIVRRLSLGSDSVVMEVASNDGYLLQYFKNYGIAPIGIEPSAGVAKAAIEKGIETRIDFFSKKFARNLEKKADLIIGNNVLAHVPDIRDFVQGFKEALKPDGVITVEFPHLLNLIRYNQFDTIYHEHFSYLSVLAVKRIFEEQGLKLIDIEKLNTHGGSLRVYATHAENQKQEVSEHVEELLAEEKEFGLGENEVYEEFAEKVRQIKLRVLERLVELKKLGSHIVGYGAAAKGNTLLNYCGIGREIIDYVVDANPNKQGCLLPGTLIPVLAPEEIAKTRPEYIIILPWTLKEEIKEALAYTKEWGAKFIVLIPEVEEFV